MQAEVEAIKWTFPSIFPFFALSFPSITSLVFTVFTVRQLIHFLFFFVHPPFTLEWFAFIPITFP